MDEMQKYAHEIPLGVYRHFKGNEYEVVGLAYDSEDMRVKVVYRALYGDRDLWVRDASMWCEYVEREGVRTRRFTLVRDSHK